MKIAESHVNRTENYRLWDDVQDIEDTIFDGKSTGDIYRWCVREFGRCTGKVYNDYLHKDSKFGPYHIGWVFVKRDKYEDSDETFLHETWITLLDRDETIRIVEYHNLGRGHK